MSLLMDALKKAELAKQGGADAPASPDETVVDAQSETEKAAITTRYEEDVDSFELTLDEHESLLLDEPESDIKPGLVGTTTVLDEPVPQAEMQEESDNDLALPDDSYEPMVEKQKVAHELEPVSQTLHTTTEAGADAGSPADTGPAVAEDEPASFRKEMPTADPQQLQHRFVLKSRAVARRKRLVLLTLVGVAFLSLLGGGYYYYNNVISSLGSSSLVVSDNLANLTHEQDTGGSAEVTVDELESNELPTQDAQDDTWPLPTSVIAPLQQSDIATQTAPVQQSVPLSKLPARDNNVSASVQSPVLTDRSKPVSAKPAQKSRIRIVRARKADPLNQRLLQAYHAYQAGNYTLAARTYHDVLEQDATNRDALLGLAAIAQRNGDREQAADYYITLLKYDPRDSIAISGLVSMQGASLTVENESRMKILLDQEPQAAHLHFTLGALYAGQSRWADAQQSFFNAHRYAPENADYAYNLAVSLDRIGKQATALEYYRRAVKLAGKQQAMFNVSEVDERINALVGLTDPRR